MINFTIYIFYLSIITLATYTMSEHFHVLSSTSNYTTYELKSNKLKVTVVPCASPFNTISTQMIYHVGSGDERVGYTGSTHLLVSKN